MQVGQPLTRDIHRKEGNLST